MKGFLLFDNDILLLYIMYRGMPMVDYTEIYNKLCILYCKTKDKKVEAKTWEEICKLINKVMNISYFSYVTRKKIFRNDNEDIISSCVVRLLTRIKKWKDSGRPYIAKHLHTVVFNEINFALHNDKQKFLDEIESLDVLRENTIQEESILDDDD